MKLHACLSLLFASSVTLMSQADIVVPGSAVGTEGPGVFALTTSAAAGRTYQMTIASNQLSGIVGEQIVGWQWRLNNASTVNWPAADTTWTAFNVFMGPGVSPSAMSNTFASNFTSSTTQVRSGGLTVPANSFTSGGTGTIPNAFGLTILFDTPYQYTGGDLAIEFRFSPQVGSTTQLSLDALAASGGPGNGWGVDFSARWTGDSAGITGANGNFVVTNLLTQAIPEPATGGFLSLFLLGLIATRRQRMRKSRYIAISQFACFRNNN